VTHVPQAVAPAIKILRRSPLSESGYLTAVEQLGRDGQEIVTHKPLFLQLCWSRRFSHFAFDKGQVTVPLQHL
jgi:hypothetical protein